MRAQIRDFVQLYGCSVDLGLAFVRPNVFAVRARGIVLPARVAHAGSWIVPVCRNARRQENNDLFEREDGRVLLHMVSACTKRHVRPRLHSATNTTHDDKHLGSSAAASAVRTANDN